MRMPFLMIRRENWEDWGDMIRREDWEDWGDMIRRKDWGDWGKIIRIYKTARTGL